MRSPAATRFLLKSLSAFVCLTASLFLCCLFASQTAFAQTKSDPPPTPASATPVTINFDNLPTGVAVRSQYPQVTFSSYGTPSVGSTIVTAYDYQLGGSSPNGIISRYNSCPSPYGCANGDVYLDFSIPVNNLSFYILGSVTTAYWVCQIDVYVSGYYYGTYNIPGNGQPTVPIFVNALRSISNITNIRMYASNVDYYGYQYKVYSDDFTFTPSFDVKITSGRVSGYLNDTTQKALLGGDVALQASIVPSNLTGGTYSWSVTGPNQQVSSTNTNSSYVVRWTETGTYQATVTYTRNGFTARATVNVNVIVPTLSSYTANQKPGNVSTLCDRDFGLGNSQYTLGCAYFDAPGIEFSSTVQIPSGSYLSDLSQSGVKYTQRVSSFRKRLNGGVTKCRTRRSSEGDNNSGWLLDGSTEIYIPDPPAVRRFSEGTSLTITAIDSPGEVLEGPNVDGFTQTPPGMNDTHQDDAFKVDDNFEMYVVYFTSTSSPLKRTVGKLSWIFGGEMVYDVRETATHPWPYRVTRPFGSAQITGVASNQPITYQGTTVDQSFRMDTCPAVPTPTPPPNPIDSTRFFVWQQYKDVLNRMPDGAWLYWVSPITDCGFDQACLNRLRIAVARGFYESAEYRQSHPGFENPGSAQYKEQYVKQLYMVYLRRPPDGAWVAWLDYLNRTGDYDGLVGGFINSSEYRNRQW